MTIARLLDRATLRHRSRQCLATARSRHTTVAPLLDCGALRGRLRRCAIAPRRSSITLRLRHTSNGPRLPFQATDRGGGDIGEHNDCATLRLQKKLTAPVFAGIAADRVTLESQRAHLFFLTGTLARSPRRRRPGRRSAAFSACGPSRYPVRVGWPSYGPAGFDHEQAQVGQLMVRSPSGQPMVQSSWNGSSGPGPSAASHSHPPEALPGPRLTVFAPGFASCPSADSVRGFGSC